MGPGHGGGAVSAPVGRSKTGGWWQTPQGTTRCQLLVPLGHPGAVMIDQDGVAFEVENVRTYEAGPGVTALFEIVAGTDERVQVGGNLLPVSDTNPEVHVGADNLRAAVRAAARRFDAEAGWYDPQAAEGAEETGTGSSGDRELQAGEQSPRTESGA